MLISICIPCYCSEHTLPSVVDEVKKEFAKHPEHDYQFVLVNDGSPDGTFEVIKRLCEQDKKITGVCLSRNFGQHHAIKAGLPYVKGDCVVVMDDDGQHPATGIFKLVDKLNEGYDCVAAKFSHKQHSLFKRMTSSLNGKMSEWAGVKPKNITFSSFYAWSRMAVDALLQYDSPFVSTGGYLLNVTQRFANVELEHNERMEGQSGYTLKKLFSLWATTLTSFSVKPLRLAMFLGMLFAVLGFAFGLFVVIRKLIVPTIAAGYTSTVALLLFIGGVILVFLGLIGEYVGRIYMTVSDKPQYLVRQTVNAEERERGK